MGSHTDVERGPDAGRAAEEPVEVAGVLFTGGVAQDQRQTGAPVRHILAGDWEDGHVDVHEPAGGAYVPGPGFDHVASCQRLAQAGRGRADVASRYEAGQRLPRADGQSLETGGGDTAVGYPQVVAAVEVQQDDPEGFLAGDRACQEPCDSGRPPATVTGRICHGTPPGPVVRINP